MAKVLVVVKVYPSDINIDLDELADKIRKKLPEEADIARSAKEPIAFGLTALKLYILIPEETEGGTESVEEALRSVDGVEEVEIELVQRVS